MFLTSNLTGYSGGHNRWLITKTKKKTSPTGSVQEKIARPLSRTSSKESVDSLSSRTISDPKSVLSFDGSDSSKERRKVVSDAGDFNCSFIGPATVFNNHFDIASVEIGLEKQDLLVSEEEDTEHSFYDHPGMKQEDRNYNNTMIMQVMRTRYNPGIWSIYDIPQSYFRGLTDESFTLLRKKVDQIKSQ